MTDKNTHTHTHTHIGTQTNETTTTTKVINNNNLFEYEPKNKVWILLYYDTFEYIFFFLVLLMDEWKNDTG